MAGKQCQKTLSHVHILLLDSRALESEEFIMLDTLSPSGIPLLTVTNYAEQSLKLSAAAPVSSPCKWCLAKGCTEQAKTHTLEQCSGLEARIQHFKSTKRTGAKSKPKQSSNAVTEFAGEASSSDSLSSDPAGHFWIPDSGATSNMTSHKEWIVDYIPLSITENNLTAQLGAGSVSKNSKAHTSP